MDEKTKTIIEIDVNKSKIIWGLFWKFMEKSASQIVSMIISLILARLLSPNDYGEIALITIFIQISAIFTTNGFNTALLRKKKADLLDFSSVLFFSIFISGIMYLLLYVSAPFIAHYYNNMHIKSVLRVVAIQLFPQAIYSIQNVYVSRNMKFKQLFWGNLLGTAVSGGIGILLALKGAGVWALVAQSIMSSTFIVCILFWMIDWRPRLQFSFQRIKELLNFGSKMLGIGLLDAVFSNLYNAIVGKVYSIEQLVFYNRGQQFPKIITSSFENAETGVSLPALASHNDDKIAVKQMTRKMIKGHTYIVLPCLAGLAAVSEPLTMVLLTEKWAASIPYMQAFCLVYVFYTLNSLNVSALYALGESGRVLKMQIVKKIAIVIEVVISIRYGIMVLVFSQLFEGIFECMLHAYLAKKVFDYCYVEQIKDVLPQILASAVMGVLVFMVGFLEISVLVQLIVQIMVGISVYILFSKIFKISALDMFLDLIRGKK